MADQPKRFYKEVTVEPGPEGFGLTLDGRPLKTPAKALFLLPSAALAEAIAEEWDAQDDKIDSSTMPLTSLGFTALDRIKPDPEGMKAEMLRYARTDLVCYRADRPQELAEAQALAWDPLIDWIRAETGLSLKVTAGIVPVEQPDDTIPTIDRYIAEWDPFRLTSLSVATASAGSLVIALALVRRHLDPQAAFEAAMVDETYQVSHWGDDDEASERRANVRLDLEAAARLVTLLEPH
ncbi:MAG: ATP12 family chaperone protein [Magnetovibrionaceae bacterium]